MNEKINYFKDRHRYFYKIKGVIPKNIEPEITLVAVKYSIDEIKLSVTIAVIPITKLAMNYLDFEKITEKEFDKKIEIIKKISGFN